MTRGNGIIHRAHKAIQGDECRPRRSSWLGLPCCGFVPPLCTPKGNTRRGWSGHLGSGIPEKPCYKAGTSIMRRGFTPRRRVESQATLWDLCRSSPDPGGKRKDRPELFFPRGFTPPSDSLESRPCSMHPLGTGVWDASRLIDPRNPLTSPGGWERERERERESRLSGGEGEGCTITMSVRNQPKIYEANRRPKGRHPLFCFISFIVIYHTCIFQ